METIKAPQTEAFLKGEGDAWYNRNSHKPKLDVVTPIILSLDIKPKIIVEFGCCDGWRMDNLHQLFPEAHCLGIDPSQTAIYQACKLYGKHGVDFLCGTADFPALKKADLIIYGFCLYLVDRCLLQRVVYEADAMLCEGGHIMIHDFNPDYPHKVPYHHLDGIFSYKMDYSKLWLGNPAYRLIIRSNNGPLDEHAVWVIRKDTASGWPLK